MDGNRATWRAALMAAATLAGEVTAAERPNVRLIHADARLAVSQALDSAAARLGRPDCAAILDEFEDVRGRSLQDNLTALSIDAPAYLSTVLFYDGETDPGCARQEVVAVAVPGIRIVKICRGFFRRWKLRPDEAEATLIHEALHTLGLGENPPSSREITARVLKRCH